MDHPPDLLIQLARRFAFADLGALTTSSEVRDLCTFGQQVLDLDAEDFGDIGPDDLRRRAAACRMPQRADEVERGALGSLIPAFELLLAVIDVHWQRREMAALLATAHIAAEYAPLLAWQPVLGHAGDPMRIGADVTGDHSRWGTDDRACPHSGPDRSAAARALRVAQEPPSGWQSYLDRQHSNTAHALATCAIDCRHPCSVLTRIPTTDRVALMARVTVAVDYADSAFVRLRHAAPVGHGFGVPSPAEVVAAWETGRAKLARHAPAVIDSDEFPLPGLPAAFSAIAGLPVVRDGLLIDVVDAIVGRLRGGK